MANPRKMQTTGAQNLAAVFDLADVGTQTWRSEELSSILRHQLDTPVQFDLSSLSRSASAKVRTMCAAEGLLLKSFHDLLTHANPPLELLELTKEFAKANLHHPDSALPAEVASVLYYASIAAARVRLHQRITRLSDAALRQGVEWCLALAWLDKRLRGLFQEAEQTLAPPTGVIS